VLESSKCLWIPMCAVWSTIGIELLFIVQVSSSWDILLHVFTVLDILDCAGVGAKIGSIKCCAPTCADDIALTGNNPQYIQTMINIAYDFSQRKGYSLQPTKSVILPVKTCNKISHEDETR
jgi:hypothetical protein